MLASAPASLAAVKALESQIEGECPGVLSDAPRGSRALAREPGHRSAREQGEENRRQRQASALETELERALEVTSLAPAREAALAFVRAVRPLKWSEPARTALTQLAAGTLELEVGGAVPPVCGDMRAWVASGYKTIGPGTKSIERSEEEVFARFRAGFGSLANLHAPAPLGRFEGPGEERLARMLAETQALTAKDDVATTRIVQRLQVVLGLQTQAESEEFEHPHKGSVEIGHGRTLADTSFKVYVEPPRRRTGSVRRDGSASIRSAVYEEPAGAKLETTIELSIGGPNEGCLSPAHPAVGCEAGVITIELRTVAAARRVRLTLSDGRRVSSRVSLIPPPAGRSRRALLPGGSRAFPHSREAARARRARHGAAHDRGWRIPRGARSRTSEQPRRRTRTLATGSCPAAGPSRSRGRSPPTRSRRASACGRNTSQALLARAARAPRAALERSAGGRTLRPPFEVQLENGCQPAEFAIVYGAAARAAATWCWRAR